ncbi:hypothetical protein Taro_004662, partial [Colocasia esculenta]|nr:hypothetical protein [Colocasia esculenta]
MEEANKSAAAQAVERSAAHISTLTPAASSVLSSSSSSTPASCDMISRIHVKARWLIRMLAWVQATLDDAEDMDITDESIRDWLRELQEVADAAEDLLDEFPDKALRLGFVGDGGWTAGSITELPRQRKRASEMDGLHDKRMEDIVSRFMKIKKPEQALKLDYHKEQMDAESMSARRTTSSVIEEPHIVGRDEELAKIKQFLLSSGAEESSGSDDMDDIPVMAIVGMGGLGKTTLAQLAYSDAQVNQHFQRKSWVCVSEDFDVIRLTKAMLQSLNVDASGLSELDPLHQKLVQKLSGVERFLLVLDDIWEAENLNIHSWKLLTAPLCNRSAGTKIIMTTRSRKVSEMAPRTSTYDLGFLSDEDTLELFMQHAFEGRDPNLYQNLVAVGKETARKCGGVPLAAKTLGCLLRTKDDEEWNKILDSEVWNATINREDSIIPLLRLSYLHLPAPLKRCFRYCSLFAKDYVFDRNRIICMWMAQGYIKTNRRELMEDIGQRYIDNLLSRSFFQKYPQNPEGLQMHDLMHDLARCVSGDECYTMEDDKPCLMRSHVRHLSIFATDHPLKSIVSSMKDISEPKSFWSLLLSHKHLFYVIFCHELPSDTYTRIEYLRVLHLDGVNLSYLPESIASLKHLRYLCISGFHMELPEFVGSMCHLQTLHLGLVPKLPSSMPNLHKLRHLILNSSHIIKYPVGIGKLTDLQTMPGFCVSLEHNHAKLGELKDMNNIRGKFTIEGLENLADVNEVKKACLDKKINISSLLLKWDLQAASSYIDNEALESLKPSVKLASLHISGFKGPSYPSWLGDQSFSRLSTIILYECRNWTFLPPFGRLPSLKSLRISEAKAVEYIGAEFFSGGFPQLEELVLECLYNWKSWCSAQKGECPKLKELYITNCENLESLPLINLGAVENISIFGCPKLRFMPGHSLELSHLQRAQTIKIKYIYKVRCIEAHSSTAAPLEDQLFLNLEDVGQQETEYILGMCSHVCRLTVRRCLNLTSLPLGNQSALKYVTITECPKLWITSISPQLWQLPSLQKICVERIHGVGCTVLFEKPCLELTNVDQLVASFLLKEFSHMIHRLVITNCANLTSLPLAELTTMTYLEISKCNQLRVSSGLQLPQSSTMQEMKVKCMCGAEYIHVLFSPGGTEALEVEASCLEFTNVDQLEASFLLNEFSHMIRRLTITQCANLTSLPWTDLTSLEYLTISECPMFQLLDAKQLPSTLQVLCIYGNPYETEQCNRHQHFQRLKQVQQCSNKEGGEHNLYLVFRNVHDASAASKFCSMDFTEIHTLDIEWDCCTNDRSNVTDAVTQEVLFNLYSLCISSKKLVIRGYTGSGFAGCYADFSSKKLHIDVFRSRLSFVSLLQCSKCDLTPLSRLPILQELYVEGESGLESFVMDCLFPYDDVSERERQANTSIAFPCLQKLEFHGMPVWKEWLGTKEGDFPFLWKLVLKHCPKLRALPHLPPGLKELILEGCEELRSLSSSSQGLKSLKSLWRLSVTNCPNLDFIATEGPPPRLELMALTGCPLLLAWCEGHPRMMESLSYLLVDGVR